MIVAPAATDVAANSGAARADAMLNLVRASTAAALSKELLKLGSSKVEKAIDKEYIKLLSTLSFECWITQYDVSRFVLFLLGCTHRKLALIRKPLLL